MATIKEDYVSFETAKLLKEKGFDEPCLMCYTSDKKLGNYGHYNSYKNSDVFSLTAPTIQMAIKWLREVHNVLVVIDVCRETGREGFYCWQLEDNHTGDCIVDIVGECPTYERACETAIKYCLENLI